MSTGNKCYGDPGGKKKPEPGLFIQGGADRLNGVGPRLNPPQAGPGEQLSKISTSEATVSELNTFKVAIPLAEGRLCNHFGHCQQFAVIRVKEGMIDGKELHTPPPHEPGVLPRWLGDLGVNLVFAGGMGHRALSLFAERGIRVITGAPNQEPEALTESYLAGNLMSGANVCDH